jgi:hypothetical protein
MIKKFRWLDYVRGLCLLLTLALFCIGLLWGEGRRPLYGPALQERGSATPSDSFCFAFLSDTHKDRGVFKPMMKEIANAGYSFAIIGGDIVPQDREDCYRFFFRQLAGVRGKIPVYFVPGNHDVYDKSGTYSLRTFQRYCGPDYYWFSWRCRGTGSKTTVVKVEDDWWLQLKGNIQYELRVRMPFLLPLTVLMGQPFFYFFSF